MKTIEEEERVFGHRTPRTLWVLGTEAKSMLKETHMERTVIDNGQDNVSVYIDVTSQFNRPQDFFEDLKKNGNFVVKIPIRIAKKLDCVNLKSRFFIFHRKYLNAMDDEEIPRVIVINNRALKKTYIFCELIPESIQFVTDQSADWFSKRMKTTSFEEVEVIKKKYVQTSFV